MKSYDEIADEYANKRLIGARTKELMKNPLFKDVAELYAQQRVNEVLEEKESWNIIMIKVDEILNDKFEDGSAVQFRTLGKTADNDSYLVRIDRHSLFMHQTSLKQALLESIEEYGRVKKRVKS